MTKQTAKLIWQYKYGEGKFTHHTWEEVEGITGYSKGRIQDVWNSYNIKAKFTRKNPVPKIKIPDEEIVSKLLIDCRHKDE